MDNDGKTISDRNDQYRNEKVCKKLKDKYNLTYGKGKEKVNVEKLKGAEQTKYEIYYAIKNILPKAKSWQQFEQALGKQGISIEYKYKGQTDEVQGVSFKKGEHSFKGSDVDRKFSYSKLDATLGYDPIQEQKQHQTVIPKGQATANPTGNLFSAIMDIASGLGSVLSIEPSTGSDADEIEFLRQQALNRKKKKPKKRRGFSPP